MSDETPEISQRQGDDRPQPDRVPTQNNSGFLEGFDPLHHLGERQPIHIIVAHLSYPRQNGHGRHLGVLGLSQGSAWEQQAADSTGGVSTNP